jgi:hypothetical protein
MPFILTLNAVDGLGLVSEPSMLPSPSTADSLMADPDSEDREQTRVEEIATKLASLPSVPVDLPHPMCLTGPVSSEPSSFLLHRQYKDASQQTQTNEESGTTSSIAIPPILITASQENTTYSK